MASTYEQWLAWYNANQPGYSQELKEAQARKQVSIGNTVPTASQQAAGVGTSSVSAKAQAAAAGNSSTTVSGKSVQQGGIPVVGVDPITGKPFKPATPIYVEGAEYDYLNALPPLERKKLQQEMYALGLYGEKAPSYTFLDTPDYAAVKKLQVAGAQIGKGDIRDVISQAKTDKALRSYLVGTSGATVNTTDIATAEAKLNKYFLDMFNEKPTKEEVALYKNTLNSAERRAKGAIGATQAEEILLKIASDKMNKITSAAKAGDTKAIASLDSGQLGKTVREIRNAYSDNGVMIDDGTIYKKAAEAMRSPTAYDNVLEDIKLSAKTQWAGFSEGLDKGRSVKTQLSPYFSTKSKVTGIPIESLTVADMADAKNPDGTLKSLEEYNLALYNSDAYKKSKNYETRTLNDLQGFVSWLGIVK